MSVCVHAYLLSSHSFSHHIQNIFHDSRLSESSRPQLAVCVCVWAHSLYGKIINLLTHLQTECARTRAIDFTCSFSVVENVDTCCWDVFKSLCELFSFQIALQSNIWTLIYIFCRKCSNASLHQVIASLPVDTLQVWHMETIKMWMRGRKYKGFGGEGGDFSSRRRLKWNCFPRFPAHVHSGVDRAWRINSCISAGQKEHIHASQKPEMSSRLQSPKAPDRRVHALTHTRALSRLPYTSSAVEPPAYLTISHLHQFSHLR